MRVRRGIARTRSAPKTNAPLSTISTAISPSSGVSRLISSASSRTRAWILSAEITISGESRLMECPARRGDARG